MHPGESLKLVKADKAGRIMSFTKHVCPNSAQSIQTLGGNMSGLSQAEAGVGIACEIVQTAAMLGIWYEMHKMRDIQNELLSLQTAAFEERKLGWLVDAFKAWIASHNDESKPGIDLDSTIALRKQLVSVMEALRDNPKMDAPQVLLLASSKLQQVLSPRLQAVYSTIDKYRLYAKSLAFEGKIQNQKPFDTRVRYFSGQSSTSRWLNIKSQKDISELEEDLDDAWFFEFSKKGKLKSEKEAIARSQDITRRYMSFQNLINELECAQRIARLSNDIHTSLPLDHRLDIYLVAKEKPRGFWKKMVSAPEPEIDKKSNSQLFEIMGVGEAVAQF
jgi:hypothetical protein